MINLMLTKSDITKIGSIVSSSVSSALKNYPTKDDLKKALAPIEKDVKIIKQTTSQIRKDLEMAVGELDKDRDNLEKRVKTVETNLGLTPTTQN